MGDLPPTGEARCVDVRGHTEHRNQPALVIHDADLQDILLLDQDIRIGGSYTCNLRSADMGEYGRRPERRSLQTKSSTGIRSCLMCSLHVLDPSYYS